MKGGILLVAAVMVTAMLLGQSEQRKFADEVTNKAVKNTRRVQQYYGSTQ